MKVESFAMTNMEEDDANEGDSRVSLPTHGAIMSVPVHFSDCGGISSGQNTADSTSSAPELCSGCHKPIYDKYYMWVDRRAWHESCVQCNVCGQALVDSCYLKNCKLYCRQDYKKLQKCQKCTKSISCNEMVRRVAGHSFHVLCFTCDTCGRQLESGDLCITDNTHERICCKKCHDREEMLDDDSNSDSDKSDDEVFCATAPHLARGSTSYQQYPHTSDEVSHMGLIRSKNGSKGSSSNMGIITADGKRQKRPRTILTTAQRRKFKASFEVSQKPCRKVRETLAAETGLTPRVVQVWFQNQRAKVKKLARRQTQGDASGQDPSRGNRIRRKKTTDSDSDNEISSPGSYTSMPTPCHNPMFQDNYRSPGSVHTSPTAASETSASVYYSSSTHQPDTSLMYDDYDQRPHLPHLDQVEDSFMTHHHPPGTSIAPVDLDSRFQSNLPDHLNDYNNNSNLMSTVNDSNMHITSPLDGFPHLPGSQSMPPFQSPTPSDVNPIDRLMYMQNSYFRT
uniref:Lmx-like LIM homeobox transcription factor 1-beta n=1 Tax=Phallusia mammillata TaxID=59560 RepID=A0A6F9DKA2_9ASCI|nr:Lmx-like LIM homeobox transcription factor 1-beta [Phallusia mammillata]